MSNEQPGDNNEDKKVIEEEEREKMLNAENKKKEAEGVAANGTPDEKTDDGEKEVSGEGRPVAGEVERKRRALEEASQEAKGRGRIPTGGIRMPGFLRPKSRDKSKDGDIDLEEGADLLKDGGKGDGEKGTSGGSASGLRSLISRFPALPSLSALPSVRLSLPPFVRKCKSKDVEAGHDGADGPHAGLAAMENLDENHAKENGDDGMENIKLDGEEKAETNGAASNRTASNGTNGVAKGDASNDQEKKPILDRILNYQHKYIIGGLILLILLVLIIVIVAISVPKHVLTPAAVIEDKYIVTHTSCGKVEGLQEDGAYAFRGIPFARPPVGDLRWKPAQPLEDLKYCWKGTYKAHNSTPPCWQIWPDGSIDGSEDCLTLDIFTNKVDFHLPLPVVVVVGSTHITGGSTQMLMMPSAKLARAREVVFVRINFRLGVMGFLTGRPLSKSVYPHTSGNYGLSDIHAALQWINRNIDKFGGDKKAVTVLGYRSGATLVTALATSNKVKGLMQRAWVTSGSADFPGRPILEVESQSQAFIDSLCGENITTTDDEVRTKIQAECLRGLGAEELLEKTPKEWRSSTPDLPKTIIKTTEAGNPNRTVAADQEHQWLVLDGDILREHPSSVMARWATDGAPIQIVIGATAHADATLELYESLGSNEKQAVEQRVRDSILSNLELADEALRRYNTTWLGLARLVTDLRTVCPLNALFMKMPQAQTHFYVVTFPYTNVSADGGKFPGPLSELGIDVAAIMGRVEGSTPEERRYVQAITRLFFNFVRNGEPHQSQDVSKGKILNVAQDTIRQHEYPSCNFWIKNEAAPHYGHRN